MSKKLGKSHWAYKWIRTPVKIAILPLIYSSMIMMAPCTLSTWANEAVFPPSQVPPTQSYPIQIPRAVNGRIPSQQPPDIGSPPGRALPESTVPSQSASPRPPLSTSTPQESAGTKDALTIYREAGINKDQENQIRQLAKDYEQANAVRLQNLLNLLQEMRALSLVPDPDEKAVTAKQEQINQMHATIAMERIKLLLKIRHVLTPPQKQHLIELMQKDGGSGSS